MADSKVTGLAEVTTPISTDVVYLVDDPGGSPLSRKCTLANLSKGVVHNSISGLTTGDPHTQYPLLLGRSGGQTLIGGTGAGDDLTLQTTSNASKGSYILSELSTGLVKSTSGTLSVITDSSSNWDAAFAHVSANGSSHTYIDQDVTTTGTPSFTSVTVGNTGLTVGASIPFSDSSGTLTLQNIDAVDATTEATIEAAIDTLANLTSIGSSTGLIKATTGTLSYITDSSTNWDAAFTHVSSNGTDHSYINQDVTSTGTPSFTSVSAGSVTVTGGSGFQIGSSTPFSDATGTLTLQNIDVLDATTEATIEAAIDTLANLTSVQGQSISLSGSLTVESGSTINQDVTSDASPTFAGLALGAGNITMSGSIGVTGTRVTKLWATDVESTNMYTVGGTSLSSTFSPIAGSGSIVTVGALDSGSITSGFGSIDTGASNIVTTGTIGASGAALANGVTATTQAPADNSTKVATTAYADAAAAAGGASTALDNLASVAINTTLISDAADTDDLGSTTKEWRSVYIGDAGRYYMGLSQDASIHRSAANTMTLTATNVLLSGDLGVTGTRVTKGWFTDLECTNDITIGGTALASTYSPIAGSASIVTTGALDSGSITSNFGNIDNGASSITTTGDITGGGIHATGDTAAGDNAAMGYTATEGLVLTGQGSSTDVTIKNDADATVMSIATGTTTTTFAGNVALGANDITMTGSLAVTGSRVTKGWFTDIESTNAPTVGGSAVYYSGGTDVAIADGGTGSSSAPTRTIVLTASGGFPSTTSGCAAAAQVEYGTNDVDMVHLDFDNTSDEYAQWTIAMPDSWDASTITAKFYWTAASSSGTVEWALQGRSYADSDAIDQSWGTAQAVNDTLLTTNDVHITSATSAITLAGTPAAGELVQFRVYRDVSEDTLAADARLIMIKIEYGTTSYSD